MRSLCAIAPLLLATAVTAQPGVPTVQLKNAAVAGLTMPAVGLGTGGYNANPAVGYGNYPECWSSIGGCGQYVQKAVTTWLQVGGKRIDAADSYQNQADVGAAIKASGVPRDQLFILSKVGPSKPLGFNESLQQFAGILSDMQVRLTEVDRCQARTSPM